MPDFRRETLGETAKSARSILHASGSDEHGTPPAYVEAGRDICGDFDLDPFSSSYWNAHVVKARRYFDERSNGFDQSWSGRLFVNPPGRPRSGNVRRAWEKLITAWKHDQVETAFWVGFSLQQLAELQSAPVHPLQMYTWIPRDRVRYMLRNGGGPPIKSENPTHGSYFTLIPTRRSMSQARTQIEKFIYHANRLDIGGAVVRPI